MDPRVEFETLRLADVSKAYEDWSRLAAAQTEPRFFQTPEWFECFRAAFGMGDSTLLVRARRAGTTVAVVPLVASRLVVEGIRLNSLELPHNPHVPFGDALVERGESESALLHGLMRHLRSSAGPTWDVLYLPNLLEDTRLMRALHGGWRGLTLMREQNRCNILPSTAYEELLKEFSKNFRGNLRKARNKLNATSGVTFRTVQDGHQMPGALEAFLTLEASGWKGADGTKSAIRLDPAATRFYEMLCETFSRTGGCEINLLAIDGRVIGGQLCLLSGTVSCMLKIAYDEAFAQLAPGNMLFEHTLRRYEREGRIRSVNLVRDASWHASWKPESLGVWSAWLFNSTARGLAAYGVRRARWAAAPIYHSRIRPMLDRLRAHSRFVPQES